MPIRNLRVESLPEPVRIDLYLAQTDLGLSRSQLKRLFGEGRIKVNGHKVKVSYKVSGGEAIEIDQPEQRTPTFKPEKIELDIVFEDEHLVVINKPPGLVVHPAPGNETGTLANALLYHFRQLAPGYQGGYPGLVHRLDKNTSGLLVVAKHERAHEPLAQQLQSRELTREYLALVWGSLQPPAGEIDLPIGRSRADRRVMSSRSTRTREAITEYETIERFPFLSYIRVSLRTGRTHQIRTHLKEKGHPVFGDPEYGGRGSRLKGIEARHRVFARELLDQIDRQMLHAARLKFVHPTNGERMQFESKLPEDFRQVLVLIRQYH
jgi:23S rRNA pseudouridine1911/1915/1917 synthase